MKVLVLGGNGFLGGYVVDALVASKHQVSIFDRYPARFWESPEEANFFQSDFGNRGELEEVLKLGIDVVVHLVSSTIPQTSNEDTVFDVQSNLVESIVLFEMCVKYNVKKIVFVSSGGTIYGKPKGVEAINEEHLEFPLCSYGIVKLSIEKYLQLFFSMHGLKYHVLRLSNPYGARQDPTRKQGVAAVFMYNMIKNRDINIWGDGNVVRDFIHASDFARACVAAVESEEVGVLNIGSGIGTSINELILALEKVLKKQASVNRLPARGFDVPRVVLNCDRAKADIDWHAVVTFEDGLFEMKNWMDEMIASGKL
jgi:UDP-glucose 4-epimerase